MFFHLPLPEEKTYSRVNLISYAKPWQLCGMLRNSYVKCATGTRAPIHIAKQTNKQRYLPSSHQYERGQSPSFSGFALAYTLRLVLTGISCMSPVVSFIQSNQIKCFCISLFISNVTKVSHGPTDKHR